MNKEEYIKAIMHHLNKICSQRRLSQIYTIVKRLAEAERVN